MNQVLKRTGEIGLGLLLFSLLGEIAATVIAIEYRYDDSPWPFRFVISGLCGVVLFIGGTAGHNNES